MKLLMSAYACEPDKGSEPFVGWNWVLQAARFHDVWVLTRSNNREAIENELRNRQIETLHFLYHDLPKWARFWKRGRRGVQLYYYLWQFTALFIARKHHRDIRFDLAHHITLVSLRHPTFLAFLGIPFIWGPIGGGERAPRSFYTAFGAKGFLKEILRDISNFCIRLDPLVRLTAGRATAILAVTQDSAERLPRSSRVKTQVMPAIGIDHVKHDDSKHSEGDDSLQLLYVGNLLYWKGVDLAIRAVAEAARHGSAVQLTIVGTGPYRRRLECLVSRLRMEERVRFLGTRSRSDVMNLYYQYDALIFPSLHDSGGFVVLEAMASGLPVICLDLGGPSLSVTDQTGVRVKASSPHQVIRDLAIAIWHLDSSPETLRLLGEASHLYARNMHGWDRKGDFLRSLYAKIESTI